MTEDDLLVRVGITEKQYLATLARMEKQSVKAASSAEKAFAKSNKAVTRSASNLNRATTNSSHSLRMMSMQLSQVAQQGAATGDYLRALAIQIPDLALGLGTVGIAAGALAPILISLGQEFLFGGEMADEFAEKLQKVSEVQGALNEELRQLRLGVSSEELTLLDAIAASRQKIAEIEEKLQGDRVRGVQALRQSIADEREQISRLEEQLQTIRRLQAEREAFTARTKETAEAERLLGEQMMHTGTELAENERIAELLREGISASVIAGMQLAGIDMASPIDAAAMAAANLASNLGIAYQAAVALSTTGTDPNSGKRYGGRGGDPRAMGGRAIDIQTAEAGDFLANYKPPRAGGGGGSAAADPLLAKLEALQESLMTEEALQIAAFERQQETLQQALEQQLLTRKEYNELTEAAQQQHADKMAQIDALRYGTGVQKAGAFFGQMADAFAQGNEEMLRLSKAFGAAQALISAYQGAAEALKLPFPANLGAYAQVLATGLGAVSAIKNASAGGGGGGAAIGGAGVAQVPNLSRNVAIQLEGDFFSGDQIRKLINAINEETEGGAIVRLV